MSKILVKQAPAVQQFQQIGAEEGSRPSIMQLFGRFKDPTASRMDKVRAGLGLAGKAGALAATGVQVANQLQGGNVGGALGAGYTYAGIDPTTGMKRDVTPAEQQRTMVMDAQKTANTQDLQAMTDAGIDVTNPAAVTQAQLQQYQEQSPMFQQQPQQQPQQTSTGPILPGNKSPKLGSTVQPQQTAAPAPAAPAPAAPAPAATNNVAAPGQIPPTQMGSQVLPQMPGQTPAPAPAAPAPAQPAPAQPAPAPAPAQPAPAQPAPAQPAPAQPAPAAPVGVKRGLLDRATSEQRFQQARQGLKQQRAEQERAFESKLEGTMKEIDDAQQPAPVAQPPVAQPPQPAPPTRDERLARAREIADRQVLVKPPTPQPAEPPKLADLPGRQPKELDLASLPRTPPPVYSPPPPPPPPTNPLDVLGGGPLNPAPKREGVEPDRTPTYTDLGPNKYTTVDNNKYSYGNQPMSAEQMYAGLPSKVRPHIGDNLDWQNKPNMQYPTDPLADAKARLVPQSIGRTDISEEGGPKATIGQERFRGPRNRFGLSSRTIAPQLPDTDALGRKLTYDFGLDASGKPDPWAGIQPWKTEKAFVDMIFNEFGDLFHKADPHEVGSIVMGLYLDRITG